MNIAINTLAIGSAGGRGYAQMLIKYLADTNASNKYYVFLDPTKEDIMTEAENFEYIKCKTSLRNIVLRLLWEQLVLPVMLKRRGVDVLYNLSGYDIFLAPCKRVFKIGNMAPFCPQVIQEESINKKIKLSLLKRLGFFSFNTADAVIAMSDKAKQDILELTNAPRNKFFGILHSADLKNFSGEDSTAAEFKESEYILTVSHIYRYKKILEVIAGFGIFLENNRGIQTKLVIVGDIRNKDYYSELLNLIKDKSLEEKVIFLGFVPRNQLYSLYKKCKILVFSSIVEACSRTLIEAMKSGTAILCSDRSAMPEICEDAAMYFDPDNPIEIAEKIEKLLSSPEAIEQMKEKSIKRAEEFDWAKTVSETLQVLQGVVT